MICKNKHCWRCMKWKKENNKPVDFSAGTGGGMAGGLILKFLSPIKISGTIPHGGNGGSVK